MKYIGKDMSRVDGVAKVTGKAKYAAEYKLDNLAYGYIVQSTIAKGKIKKIDTANAEKAAGVVRVFTHENTLRVEEKGSAFRAFQSDEILFAGQPVALVVAETFEQARHAASLVTVEFDKSVPQTDIFKARDEAARLVDRTGRTKARGNPAEGFENSDVKFEAEYSIPIEHHSPMEPHAATAFWKDGKLTIFDKSQGVYGVQEHLAESFKIPKENVNVVSLFVGGAFGSSLLPHYYPFLASFASQKLERPVRVVYTRRQMFTGHGYRPFTVQKLSVGAAKDGKLQSVIHRSFSNTSSFENFSEGSATFGRTLYECPNYDSPYSIVKTDLPTPTWMRAPGAVSGAFALESAIDELSYKLGIDPLEMRKINYAEKDPETGKPFSSKALMKCFEAGASKFGWDKRKPEPRSMRDGDLLVGWGTAIGTWGAWQAPASVKITLRKDGTVHVGSATSDIGPGTYTVITMIAAEFLGVAPEKIKFELGDTRLPEAPSQGGSITTASVGSAVYGAAMKIKEEIHELSIRTLGTAVLGTPKPEDLELADGNLRLVAKPEKSVSVEAILTMAGKDEVVVDYKSMPNAERGKYTTMAHGAQFVEVKVDEAIGKVMVTRVVEATACGRIMNPKTSHSQEMGGIVWGIGMALHEDTQVDHRFGKMMTTNFADYHIPAHADVLHIETDFVEEEDKIVNELGIKGMGELCLVGIPAAIANAVYHATGKRIRELPITVEKVMG
ncbi:MAG: xanthine dehydrogenase family protein molybdopterin-binding subunit [Pyrinomonadaceae bacterium]